jgi:3-phenylpropionate/trans-cinnamate dioxygenase ferredoxin component
MNRHPVASFADLKEGIGLKVDLGDHRIAVFLVGGEVFAIGDRCSHAEASLSEGEIFDHEVECPRHGSAFDIRTGEPLSLPATKAVPTYLATIEAGTVFVEVSE